VRDGRTLERPVNYVLARILPPDGTKIDPTKAPVIIVDPRAGHGPGIGGMKRDSEVGVALSAGHPCYFVGFLPKTGTRSDNRGCLPCRGHLHRGSGRATS
jgi:hypothetical protein